MTAAALIFAMALAGVIYGFAGFGAALIFMPVGAALVGPETAVAAMSIGALGSIVSVLPEAWARADQRATSIMLGAMMLALPPGVWVLRAVDPAVLRWAISALVLATLALLMTGWRYRGKPGVPAWLAVGAGVGFCGGSTGLNGPPLVLFQLGGRDAAERSRANTIVVLSTTSIALLPVLWLGGAMSREALWLGLPLLPVYAVGCRAGRALFTPARAGLYRRVAYGVIGVSAVLGLPIW